MTSQSLSSDVLPSIKREPPRGIPADWDRVSDKLRMAITTAIKSQDWPIVLMGVPGCGKTSTMACVYRSIQAKPKWFSAIDVIRIVQAMRRDGSILIPGAERPTTEGSFWRVHIEQPALLCIDDIGLRKPTDSQYEIIYELLDRRQRKPLMVTSNLSPRELQEQFDSRVISRLFQGTSIEVTGSDRRREGLKRFRVAN